MTKKIPCQWFLGDGIADDTRLDAPEDIRSALKTCGILPDEDSVNSRLHSEWIYRRTWVYKTDFKLEKPEAGRVFLELDGLLGKSIIKLNGEELTSGNFASARCEISGRIKADNLLEIVFPPESTQELYPLRGFCGSVFIKSTGSTAITALEYELENDYIVCNIALDTPKATKCTLTFSVQAPAGTLENSITESLSAGYNPLRLTPFEHGTATGQCEITLKLFIDESESDSIKTAACFLSSASPRGFVTQKPALIELAAAAGATSVFSDACDDIDFRLTTSAARCGLALKKCEACDVYTCATALQKASILSDICGGELELLNRSSIWKLTDSDKSAYDDARSIASVDLNAIVSVSRYLQAVKLKRLAESVRVKNGTFALKDVANGKDSCASCGLIDRDGGLRPAYYAIMNVWEKEHAFISIPDTLPYDGIFNADVMYVCDEFSAGTSIKTTLYALNGSELVSVSLPVYSPGAVGKMLIELPGDGFALARSEVMRLGKLVSVSDCMISLNGEQIPPTQLICENERVTNVGENTAIGVCIPGADWFGALLPGEFVSIPDRSPGFVEGLNIYM